MLYQIEARPFTNIRDLQFITYSKRHTSRGFYEVRIHLVSCHCYTRRGNRIVVGKIFRILAWIELVRIPEVSG